VHCRDSGGARRKLGEYHFGHSVLQKSGRLGAWTRVSRLLRIPAFPKVCVLADVCRHDLLVEMEAVATI